MNIEVHTTVESEGTVEHTVERGNEFVVHNCSWLLEVSLWTSCIH